MSLDVWHLCMFQNGSQMIQWWSNTASLTSKLLKQTTELEFSIMAQCPQNALKNCCVMAVQQSPVLTYPPEVFLIERKWDSHIWRSPLVNNGYSKFLNNISVWRRSSHWTTCSINMAQYTQIEYTLVLDTQLGSSKSWQWSMPWLFEYHLRLPTFYTSYTIWNHHLEARRVPGLVVCSQGSELLLKRLQGLQPQEAVNV